MLDLCAVGLFRVEYGGDATWGGGERVSGYDRLGHMTKPYLDSGFRADGQSARY